MHDIAVWLDRLAAGAFLTYAVLLLALAATVRKVSYALWLILGCLIAVAVGLWLAGGAL